MGTQGLKFHSWHGQDYEIVFVTIESVFESKELTCYSRQALRCSVGRTSSDIAMLHTHACTLS